MFLTEWSTPFPTVAPSIEEAEAELSTHRYVRQLNSSNTTASSVHVRRFRLGRCNHEEERTRRAGVKELHSAGQAAFLRSVLARRLEGRLPPPRTRRHAARVGMVH